MIHIAPNNQRAWHMAAIIAVVLLYGGASARAQSGLSGPEWLREGNRLLAEGSPEKALGAYDQAALLLPDSAEVSYNRGIALYELQRYEEAETALQNALRPGAAALEAAVKYNLGRTAQARALASGGDADASLQQTERAIRFYEDALELRPDDADAKRNLEQARRFHAFLKKLMEYLKEQTPPQKENQPDPTSQPEVGDDKEESGEKSPNEAPTPDAGEQSQEPQDGGEPTDSESDSAEAGEGADPQDGQNGSDTSPPEGQPVEEDAPSEQQPSGEKPGESERPGADGSSISQDAGAKDDRTDSEKGDDLLEERDASDDESEKDQRSATSAPETETMQWPATTQPITSQPAETPEQRMQRLSMEQALRLLQEARDKEAKRREALREAKLRRQGRTPVAKDW